MKQSILCLYLASIFFTMSCNLIIESEPSESSNHSSSFAHTSSVVSVSSSSVLVPNSSAQRSSSSLSVSSSIFSSSSFISSSSIHTSSSSSWSSSSWVSSSSLKYEKPPYIPFIDERDGQSYLSIAIGEQIWMAENLNYSANNTVGFCSGETTTAHAPNCDSYGRLYDWYIAMDNAPESIKNPSMVQGICPTGWHVPSDSEWDQLMEYVDAHNGSEGVGQSLKATTLWSSHSAGGVGTDLFGFSALPGGFGGTYSKGGYYDSLTNYGIHWSTSVSGRKVLRRDFRYSDHALSIDYSEKLWMGSVRCVKDL
ncbi:MAG: hypothetical protein OCC49_16250 [Fibrobacterales bacterium]